MSGRYLLPTSITSQDVCSAAVGSNARRIGRETVVSAGEIGRAICIILYQESERALWAKDIHMASHEHVRVSPTFVFLLFRCPALFRVLLDSPEEYPTSMSSSP